MSEDSAFFGFDELAAGASSFDFAGDVEVDTADAHATATTVMRNPATIAPATCNFCISCILSCGGGPSSAPPDLSPQGRSPVRGEAGRNGIAPAAYSFARFFLTGAPMTNRGSRQIGVCICGRSSVANDGARPVMCPGRSRLHRRQEDSWSGMQVQVTLA